ncbi:MAG: hypothetical protein FJ271_24130 [Planctomycetes bacterium]|nr:hypothetical protein [Planctomycetota bacterium]
MSINIPTYYVQQYATNIQLLLQQMGSKLRDRVTVGSYVGKAASPVEQIGTVAMQPVTSRFAPMGRVDAPLDRRWVYPSDFDLPQLIDQFDKLRLLIDPASSYVQSAVYAAGRQMDDLIITSFFGDAKTGETGGTTTSFGTTLTTSSGRNVGVAHGAAAATGLTVAKLREAKKRLMASFVDIDSDPISAVVTAAQHDNLLSEAQVISTDFNERPVLVDGKVTRFLGIDIVHCERLVTGTDDAAGTSRAIPVFARSGMHLALWNDLTTDITQRKDLQGLPYQAYVYMTAGATRLEENKVVRVWSRE